MYFQRIIELFSFKIIVEQKRISVLDFCGPAGHFDLFEASEPQSSSPLISLRAIEGHGYW
jgi:hypothetical protein